MSFAVEEIAEVKHIVQQALEEYSPNASAVSPPALVFRHNELELLDRIVRVEEELKYLREDSNKNFAQVEKRFAETQANTDKRFAEMLANTNTQFAQAENRQKHRPIPTSALPKCKQIPTCNLNGSINTLRKHKAI